MKSKKLIAGICAILMATSVGTTLVATPVKAFAKESASANISLQDYANEVVSLVNQERAKQGLNALQVIPALNNAATKRSQELVTLFSHTRPDGSNCATVLNEFGVTWKTTGENIAYGYATPEDVMTGWMNSSGHRANILSENFDSIGIGVVSENGVLYWTQVFAGGISVNNSVTTTPTITPSVPDKPTQDNSQNNQDNNAVPSQPVTTPCIGDNCPVIICKDGTCTINGKSCSLQDLLSELNHNSDSTCKDNTCVINGKTCNSKDLLSALGQNCENNNCNSNILECILKNCK
ncbi:MAG: hypothetical protein K2J25_07840 [Oscillospiraceae bacterium]|nr:hypothetical protein [Oscillospiraceae bacterium]